MFLFFQFYLRSRTTETHASRVLVPQAQCLEKFGKDKEALLKTLGMTSLDDHAGAMVNMKAAIDKACSESIAKHGSKATDAAGFVHMQIIGDGARALKTMNVLNIAIRAFHHGDYYRSYNELEHMYVTKYNLRFFFDEYLPLVFPPPPTALCWRPRKTMRVYGPCSRGSIFKPVCFPNKAPFRWWCTVVEMGSGSPLSWVWEDCSDRQQRLQVVRGAT